MKILRSLLLLVVPIGCFAQGSPNSVAQLILSNSTNGIKIQSISPSNLIGQNSHQLFLYTANNGGNTCTPGYAGNAYLQGSIDGITYVQISSSITNNQNINTNITPLVAFASGVYPYIQVVYGATPNTVTNCLVTLWYTASQSPQAYTGSPRTVNDGFFQTSFAISSSGNTILATPCVGRVLQTIPVLYGFYLLNGASTANTVILQYGNDGLPYTKILTLTGFTGNNQFNGMPLNGKPYFVAYPGLGAAAGNNNFTLNLSAATEIDGYLIYRCE